MPVAPWASDRHLDLETATAVVEARFPDLRPVRCRLLGAGWDNEAYLVNDIWVFRFPRRREVGVVLEREAALLPVVRDALDLPVPVPELFGEPCERFPYPFHAHRFVPGTPADFTDVAESDEAAIAAALGRALTQLHAIPVDRVAALELPFQGDRCAAWRRWVVDCAEAFRAVMPAEVVARWEPWLRGEMSLPPAAPGPFPLGHNDLGAEHVLLDPVSKRVTGIIDWADAALVDPASDFAGLHLWRGEAFTARLLAHYGRPVDAGLMERVRFIADGMALTLVAESHLARDAPGLERWRRFFVDVFEPRRACERSRM